MKKLFFLIDGISINTFMLNIRGMFSTVDLYCSITSLLKKV